VYGSHGNDSGGSGFTFDIRSVCKIIIIITIIIMMLRF